MKRFVNHHENGGSFTRNHSASLRLLIESGALTRLKSIQIMPISETDLVVKALFQIKDDYHWHMLSEVTSDPNEAFFIGDTLIDCHEQMNPDDSIEMNKWRKAIANPQLYFITGVSVYFGL